MKKSGILTVMSGFSGAGKGTIVNKLISKYPYFLSVSCTTRKPRPGEVDGKDYFFVSKEEFEEMIREDKMIEWAEYAGNYYGTPKKAVEDQLSEGKDVILEIEVQGGMQVKRLFPDSVMLFVVPPSAEELLNRLRTRGTEDESQINTRFEQTTKETDFIRDYDYLIINDDLDRAVEEVNSIIFNEHDKVIYKEEEIRDLSEDLSKVIQENKL